MRCAALLLLAGLVFSAPAAAVLRTPQMTLRPADLPRGFVLDQAKSGGPTFSSPTDVPAGFRAGYVASYRDPASKPTRTVAALAYVFSSADTADGFLVTVRRLNARLRSSAVSIGSRGVLLARAGTGSSVIVAWRQGRVAGVVVSRGFDRPRERAISFARAQERRIVSALR